MNPIYQTCYRIGHVVKDDVIKPFHADRLWNNFMKVVPSLHLPDKILHVSSKLKLHAALLASRVEITVTI